MSRKSPVNSEEMINMARTIVRVHGHIEAKPPNNGPPLRCTPTAGVDGFHVCFGEQSGSNPRASYIKIVRDGKLEDSVPRNEEVFNAIFFAGRENDPHKLFMRFDPDDDWRKKFITLANKTQGKLESPAPPRR